MATAESAKLQVEQGQSLVAYVALTDSGDHQHYTPAAAVLSGKSGYAPIVRPNGIVSGLNLVSVAASGTNNLVDVAAFTAYSAGTLYSVSAATDETITRGATDVAKICSVTMTDAGAIAIVAGTDSADATFSEVRAAAGGPPLIPVDSVALAQVRMTGNTAAAITASEILQTVGTHAERYDFPVWETNNVGDGSGAAVSAKRNAYVKMASVLPASHTGPISKKVYVQYYTPTFADISKSVDFTPAETTHSVSSSQYYNGTIASKSSTLGQGGFTALLDDGISDALVAAKNQVLTFKFFADRNKAPYILTQGTLGVSRTFPVADQVQLAATISAETSSAEFTS